jgi:hypothetical protein
LESGGDLIRIQKIEAFAKASAKQMATSFAASFEQKIYVYQKNRKSMYYLGWLQKWSGG